TGAVPSDRTIVVERFRDEIGDWRVCILTPFGGRVHAPWAMAIAARLKESLGIDAQSIWSDDGIALHFPEADTPPPLDELMIDPGEVEDLVVAELGETALFGARFRENAGRSLLIPRRRPGERTPLWQQRPKAQSLLQVDRDLLRELLGQEELRDLLDHDAVEEVERQLQGDPKTPDHLHDKLRLRGDLRPDEYDPELAAPLLTERRALLVRIAGEERLIAV